MTHHGNAGLSKAHCHRGPCWLEYKARFQTSASFLAYHNNTPSQEAWRFRVLDAVFVHLLASWDGFLTGQSVVSLRYLPVDTNVLRVSPITPTPHSLVLKPQLTQLSGLQTQFLACDSEGLDSILLWQCGLMGDAINCHVLEPVSLSSLRKSSVFRNA